MAAESIKERSQSPLFPSEEHGRSENFSFPVEEHEQLKSLLPQPEQLSRPKHSLPPPEENEVEINTSAWERCDEIMTDISDAQSPEPQGAVVLDPEYSERQYYREPQTGFQREIWRPGDGDGSQSTDYYQRKGPVLPLEQRWRLFQSNIGPLGLGKNKTEPPRFVFLDDCAAHEVLTSDIQRARLNREWPHDFAANGKIRARRTHCGRPAFKDAPSSEHHSAPLTKTSNYFFTGEKDYKPIIYRVPPTEPSEPTVEELIRKRKAEDTADPSLYNPRAHGHNQYTPRDLMVKFGAATFSRKKVKGEDIEMLAKLKAMAPNVLLKDKLIPRVAFGNNVSNAGSVRCKGKTVVSEMTGFPPQLATTPPNGGTLPSADSDDQGSASAQQDQDQDGGQDSDSDTDIFPKVKAATRHDSTPTPSVAAALSIPRQMGYIERRIHEQALALKTMNAVQNQDDVVRIASELAEANVALADQAKEIESLKRNLEESQSLIRYLHGAIEEQGLVVEGVQGDDDNVT